jgi:hypothetical protein
MRIYFTGFFAFHWGNLLAFLGLAAMPRSVNPALEGRLPSISFINPP